MSFLYASGVGYFLRTISSSSASLYLPRCLKPEYQTSNGSRGRPSRFSIDFATRGTSGDVRTSSNILRTRASGSSRFSSKRRAIKVGAVGE